MKNEFIEKLDNVLKYLNKNRKIDCYTEDEIIKNCFGGVNTFENKDVLDQLKEDKYITTHIQNEALHVRISHRGRLFIENEGYRQQRKESNRRKTVEKIHHYSLSIGTILAGLYALCEIVKWAYRYFYY